MLFDVLLLALCVFKAPYLTWLAAIFVFARHVRKAKHPKPKKYYLVDEFDIWQDNQGL